MKSKTVPVIRKELATRSHKDLQELCLRLARFKVENKELLSYVLFDSDYEDGYIEKVKEDIKSTFEDINTSNVYYAKKGIRKILKNTKKHIRYSKKKETEIELLMCFCTALKTAYPHYRRSKVLVNVLETQISRIYKIIDSVHEDLQFDFKEEMKVNGLS